MFKHYVSQLFCCLCANLLKVVLYIIRAPILVIFTASGLWFLIALFLWVVLICAAFVCAVLAFVASFYTVIVALFVPDPWNTIGSWWSWIWSWFASGNVSLWPHFVKSIPPYLVSGLLMHLLNKSINRLTVKVRAIRLQHDIT